MNNLIDRYPDFAVVEFHVGNDGYDTPWGDDRADFYNVWGDGIPWFAYDGLFDAWPINTYESKLQQRLLDPTDVVLSVWGSELGPDTYEITTEVCLEPAGTGRTFRVYMVQVLDNWPASPSYSRNTFKQAADTEDVALAPGECTQIARTFILDTDSTAQIEDVKVVAWAQDPLPSAPAKVHQAKVSTWPFVEVNVFADGFESGDTTAWTVTVP